MQAAIGVNVSEFSPRREYLGPRQLDVFGQPQAPSTWERHRGFSILDTWQRKDASTQFSVDFGYAHRIDLYVGYSVRCLSSRTFADGQDDKVGTDGGRRPIACCAGAVIAARRRDQKRGE
jgi:hypothetical protein